MASPQRVVHQIAPGVPSSGEPVVDFGASLFLGPWEALKGAVLGVAGVFIDPIQGAAEGGLPGFLWGVGTGVTGVVLKPVAGALTGTHVGACRAPPLLYHGPSPPRPPPPPPPTHILYSVVNGVNNLIGGTRDGVNVGLDAIESESSITRAAAAGLTPPPVAYPPPVVCVFAQPPAKRRVILQRSPHHTHTRAQAFTHTHTHTHTASHSYAPRSTSPIRTYADLAAYPNYSPNYARAPSPARASTYVSPPPPPPAFPPPPPAAFPPPNAGGSPKAATAPASVNAIMAEALARSFAKGEITKAEYEAALQKLVASSDSSAA